MAPAQEKLSQEQAGKSGGGLRLSHSDLTHAHLCASLGLVLLVGV